jgi:hypothetical protein
MSELLESDMLSMDLDEEDRLLLSQLNLQNTPSSDSNSQHHGQALDFQNDALISQFSPQGRTSSAPTTSYGDHDSSESDAAPQKTPVQSLPGASMLLDDFELNEAQRYGGDIGFNTEPAQYSERTRASSAPSQQPASGISEAASDVDFDIDDEDSLIEDIAAANSFAPNSVSALQHRRAQTQALVSNNQVTTSLSHTQPIPVGAWPPSRGRSASSGSPPQGSILKHSRSMNSPRRDSVTSAMVAASPNRRAKSPRDRPRLQRRATISGHNASGSLFDEARARLQAINHDAPDADLFGSNIPHRNVRDRTRRRRSVAASLGTKPSRRGPSAVQKSIMSSVRTRASRSPSMGSPNNTIRGTSPSNAKHRGVPGPPAAISGFGNRNSPATATTDSDRMNNARYRMSRMRQKSSTAQPIMSTRSLVKDDIERRAAAMTAAMKDADVDKKSSADIEAFLSQISSGSSTRGQRGRSGSVSSATRSTAKHHESFVADDDDDSRAFGLQRETIREYDSHNPEEDDDDDILVKHNSVASNRTKQLSSPSQDNKSSPASGAVLRKENSRLRQEVRQYEQQQAARSKEMEQLRNAQQRLESRLAEMREKMLVADVKAERASLREKQAVLKQEDLKREVTQRNHVVGELCQRINELQSEVQTAQAAVKEQSEANKFQQIQNQLDNLRLGMTGGLAGTAAIASTGYTSSELGRIKKEMLVMQKQMERKLKEQAEDMQEKVELLADVHELDDDDLEAIGVLPPPSGGCCSGDRGKRRRQKSTSWFSCGGR